MADGAFFKRIAIIGVGLIGGSMGLALKRAGFSGQVVGVSRPETIDRAREMGVIDVGWDYADMERALEGADLIFLCAPIQRILGLLETVGRYAPAGGRA